MAILSMTGFGKSSAESEELSLEIEVKSVNHRYLDVNIRQPQAYSVFESELQALVRSKLGRGRVEISVSRRSEKPDVGEISLNEELLKQHANIYQQAAKAVGGKFSLDYSLTEILKKKDVIEVNSAEEDYTAELDLLKDTLSSALDSLIEARAKEGESIQAHLDSLVGDLKSTVSEIEKLSSEQPPELKASLLKRLEALDVNLDSERLEQEAAILADKADISEEIERLKSHFKQTSECLDSKEVVGRRLEFTAQEMGREVNTIGSKSQSYEITAKVIDAKSMLEKFREQIANVE